MDEFPVFWFKLTDRRDFLEFWSKRYDDDTYPQEVYRNAIEPDLSKPVDPDKLRILFQWKNGIERLAGKKAALVSKFVDLIPQDRSRIDDARCFLESCNPRTEFIRESGAVWRIFFLHCCRPDKFPIYDQHVHRAMRYLQKGCVEEPPKSNKKKISVYCDEYLKFWEGFKDHEPFAVDRALWAFGKFLATPWATPGLMALRRDASE